jgi:histidine triad (HIT) family protein
MTYDSNNIFARILRGEIPCKKVHEDAHTLAFYDINPAAPTHILVIPKGEYVSFHDFAAQASSEEMSAFFKTVQHIAEQAGVHETGYRLLANHGSDAGQEVPHFHVHILGGRPLGGLLAKG